MCVNITESVIDEQVSGNGGTTLTEANKSTRRKNFFKVPLSTINSISKTGLRGDRPLTVAYCSRRHPHSE